MTFWARTLLIFSIANPVFGPIKMIFFTSAPQTTIFFILSCSKIIIIKQSHGYTVAISRFSNKTNDKYIIELSVPNSYPSGHDLCRFTSEFTPSFMPTLEDLAIETIDNGFGKGSDSELHTIASRNVTNNNTAVKKNILYIL